ncbi:MAG: transcription elongation factor GreA [Clostridia bacterium]|nr:transcription elongation factor GreA [Clostridia bacterium]
MAEKKVVLTPEGVKNLEAELEYLKVTKRREVAEKIKIARGFGDLSENAEYDAAKDEQGKMEIRIVEIEKMLRNAEIVDESDVDVNVVGICAKVTVLDLEFDEEETFMIVGSTEADPNKNKISDESPIGKALIGHAKGDVVDIETPGGTIQFKIIDISK